MIKSYIGLKIVRYERLLFINFHMNKSLFILIMKR